MTSQSRDVLNQSYLQSYLLQSLNMALGALMQGETSYTNSFNIVIQADGFIFVPRLPCAYILDDDLIRHQRGMKELCRKRKATIERIFGTVKEYHKLRYTREKGKSKMDDKVGLTLACLNIKKLMKWIANILFYFSLI